MIKTIIKSLLPYGLVNKIIIKRNKQPFILNYYNTDFPKNVLLTYVISPFLSKEISYAHTNNIEALSIAEVFKGLNFNVDICHFEYDEEIDYTKYNIIFGFGDPLTNSFYNRTTSILTIYYGTGMHICTQNYNTLNRIEEVYEKRHVWIPESGRIVDNAWSIQTTIVNAIVTLWNQEVVNSYSKYFNKNIYNVPVSFYEILSEKEVIKIIENKNFSEARYHFLWFGSSGLIHKGLDLLLDIFSKINKYHLHICGPIENEHKFKKVYYQELYKTSNIHMYGFIQLESVLFKNLMQNCAFVIFPSCSEGGGASVINVMANGLIPIVTREASIEVKKFGLNIDQLNENAIEQSMKSAILLSDSELTKRSMECFHDTRCTHSINAYKTSLNKALTEIVGNEM